MNCRIVFYSAKKTSYCEKALRKSVSGLGLNVKTASYAVNGEGLGEQRAPPFGVHREIRSAEQVHQLSGGQFVGNDHARAEIADQKDCGIDGDLHGRTVQRQQVFRFRKQG